MIGGTEQASSVARRQVNSPSAIRPAIHRTQNEIKKNVKKIRNKQISFGNEDFIRSCVLLYTILQLFPLNEMDKPNAVRIIKYLHMKIKSMKSIGMSACDLVADGINWTGMVPRATNGGWTGNKKEHLE